MYDELIKRLRDWTGVCAQYDGSVDQLHDDAADAIEELQGRAKVLEKVADKWCEAVPKWISVTERLPATEDHVLAATQNKAGKYNIVKAYYSHDLHCWAAGMNSNVTHWMPLPEPPKEG